MYWIVNESLDPAFILALEEHFLGKIEPGHPGYAILWQNRPTIVVGRFQNARQEVNADFVRERGISVVRRMTGGGAVYHDASTTRSSTIWTRKARFPRSARRASLLPKRCKTSGCR